MLEPHRPLTSLHLFLNNNSAAIVSCANSHQLQLFGNDFVERVSQADIQILKEHGHDFGA